MNILITGGSGFIGSYLVEELSKIKGSKIYVIDKKKLSKKYKNVYFIKSDLRKDVWTKKINNSINYIYHLAADLGVKKTIQFPIESLKNNLKTTENIIKFAKKQKKIKRLFFFSTSEVYSQLNKSGKMHENDSLVLPSIHHPRSSYWLSKIYGEFLIIRSKIPFTIFRGFNFYGAQMKITHVIPSIFYKLKNDKNPIFENPNHTRCFLYMPDAVKILVYTLKTPFKNQIINVANPYEEIRIKDLVKKIKIILNCNKKIRFKNIENLSIVRKMPDITKIRKLFKNKIRFTKLSDGLLSLKEYYEK